MGVRLANMGNRQAIDELAKLLDIKGVSIEEVFETLAEYCEHLDDSARDEKKEISGFVTSIAEGAGMEVPKAIKGLTKVGGSQPSVTATVRKSDQLAKDRGSDEDDSYSGEEPVAPVKE